jgi:hypothetical protein
MAVLFLLTRKIAAELGAVISFSEFHATSLEKVVGMQCEQGLSGRWSKETRPFVMQGGDDVFVTREVFRSWVRQLEGFRIRGKGIGGLRRGLLMG